MKFSFFSKNKHQSQKTKLSTEKKQKILAIVIFGLFFFGLACLCVQQFPDINRGASEYQDEENFTVQESSAEINKAAARNSKNSRLELNEIGFIRKFQFGTELLSGRLAALVPSIGLSHMSSTYRTEKYPRIILDQSNRFINIPQWHDVEGKVEAVNALADLSEKKDSAFFLVQMPTAIKKNTILPQGLYDNSTPQINRFLSALKKNEDVQINVFDLRKRKQFKNAPTTFTNDALILPEISHQAADIVANKTIKKGNNLSSANNYRITTLKNHFVGDYTTSFGERTISKSDFEIILPTHETKYKVNTFNDGKMETNSSNTFTGAMKDSVMDYSLFASPTDCVNGYLRKGDYCVGINNLSIEDDNHFRALIISDQQGTTFASFFSQYASHVTFVNVEAGNFPNRISSLIKKGKYDAVYLVVADTSYANINFWKFDHE